MRASWIVGLAVALGCSGGEAMTSATGGTTATSATTTSSEGSSSAETTSSGGTSAGETTSTTSTTTAGETLPWARDDLPVGIGCDPFLQTCYAGQKCNYWAEEGSSSPNAAKCVPVDPDPDAVGEPCTVQDSEYSGYDSCEAGAICWYVDVETLAGICVSLCIGSVFQCSDEPESCCPDGSHCWFDASGITLCKESCDPLAQDCTMDGDACYPTGNRFECFADDSGDMGAIGDPCEFINVCDPGLFCANPAVYPGCDPLAGGCCIPFCSLAMPTCVAGTECLPWYDPLDVPPGYEDVGACVIPS